MTLKLTQPQVQMAVAQRVCLSDIIATRDSSGSLSDSPCSVGGMSEE